MLAGDRRCPRDGPDPKQHRRDRVVHGPARRPGHAPRLQAPAPLSARPAARRGGVAVDERNLPARNFSPLPGRPPAQQQSLADILERVLDKGIVIAGDIQINLLDVELLTIKLRLLVASVERAQEMGINWWESDPTLSSKAQELEEENEDLRSRLERVEEVAGLP